MIPAQRQAATPPCAPVGKQKAEGTTARAQARLLEWRELEDAAGELLALVIGVFGRGRASRVQRQPALAPAPAQAAVPLPFLPGVTPNFTSA